MKSSNQPYRKSIRLKEYDYSFPGWYYITICTHNRMHIFGKILSGKIVLNDFGKIVEEEWLRTKELRKTIDLDYNVIMPNHFHGILINEFSSEKLHDTIIESGRGELNSPDRNNMGRMQYAPTNDKFKSPSQTLGAVVRGFKSSVTKRIRENTGNKSFLIWQRNYYEHIIRNELDLHNIRQYIENNPLKWELDEYYNL
jgi:REP element-mobilizing transposase RayT